MFEVFRGEKYFIRKIDLALEIFVILYSIVRGGFSSSGHAFEGNKNGGFLIE